ncbi:hypothetical protein B0H19DRAFT_1386707 [Mycena capillaripes]|nr:hypothetical protein B0H19DRAFT_1386707 [Mycena capillaripes]
MPSTASAAIAKSLGTFVEYFFITLCSHCLLCFLCAGGGIGKCGTNRVRRRQGRAPKTPRAPYHRPLPTTRIDIRQLPIADQPQSRHLLKLPLELWESIYEHALGGRLITIRIAGSQHKKSCVVRSQFYLPEDDLAHDPAKGIPPAERICTTLLLSCRQVYSEALPILHGHNTFHFWTNELETIIRCGLGYYALPHIRSVYTFHYDDMFQCPSTYLFAILRQMSLDRVAFEFLRRPEFTEPDIYSAALYSPWGRGVIGLRTLRRFELWFSCGREGSLTDLVDEKDLVERLQQLMMAGADERYRLLAQEGALTYE